MKANIRLLILSFLIYTSHSFGVVTVGNTNDCDFNNLEDAFNSADPIIRATNQVVFNDVFVINKSKFITGGFDTCADAEAGDLGANLTQWTNAGGAPVVNINSGNANSIVFIDRFEIFGGNNQAFGQTGGVDIRGNSGVNISNSIIRDNNSNFGGGVSIFGAGASAVISNTQINNNNAKFGGGISCSGSATLSIEEGSAIRSNTATDNGGGLYAENNCQASIKSGDTKETIQADLGIISNTAEKQGGGVYIKSGADVRLEGNDEYPANIIGNRSNIDLNIFNIGGGGVFVIGEGSTFTSINGRIDFNSAKHAGGGIAALDRAKLFMSRLKSRCWDNDKCSSLSFNFVTGDRGFGGAGALHDNSTASITGTYITGNLANETTLFNLRHDAKLVLESNLLVGNGAFNQQLSDQLFSLFGNNGSFSHIGFFFNTLVKNRASSMFFLDGTSSQQHLLIYNSIIRDNGPIINTMGNLNPVVRVNCNYVHETASLALATTAVDNFNLVPGFVDPLGDYHLSSGSLARDLCNQDEILDRRKYPDLNGNSRGYDDSSINNLRGPYDAGAYEDPADDLIFLDGF